MLTINKKNIRSPFFYVGDKYKLINQLDKLFPSKIDTFYEPFTGGGTVFLNVEANQYFINDIDENLINIHKFLTKNALTPDKFFDAVAKVANEYKLSQSHHSDIVPLAMKKEFKKTYYARYNKAGYNKLKENVNTHKKNDPLTLYILLIYGFNRMLRFNNEGKFNLPVGNVDFNKNVVIALRNYFKFVRGKKIKFTSTDFKNFFKDKVFNKNDFVYLDPPYLITSSEYNKLWNEETETELLRIIDKLNTKGVQFALSNVTEYNGKMNHILISWMKKYKTHTIKSNYINYHNNKQKIIKEVLITNY